MNIVWDVWWRIPFSFSASTSLAFFALVPPLALQVVPFLLLLLLLCFLEKVWNLLVFWLSSLHDVLTPSCVRGAIVPCTAGVRHGDGQLHGGAQGTRQQTENGLDAKESPCRQRRQNHLTAVTKAVKLLDECNGAMVARSIRQGKLYILYVYIYVHMKAKWKRNESEMKALNKRNRLQMAAESLVLWWLGSLLGKLAPPSREWRPTRRALPCFAPVQSNFVTQLE